MIRKVTIEDKEWVLDVAEKVYSGTKFGWVRDNASRSFDLVVAKKGALLIRGEKTFIYCSLIKSMSDYSIQSAHMILLVGEGNSGMEPLRLLQYAKEWQKQNGAIRFNISSITDHQFGERLMKKLGAVPTLVYDIDN